MSASSTPTVRPRGGEGGGEVDGDRRLADAALARGDQHDLGGGRERRCPRARWATFQRALAMAAAFSSWVISVQSSVTLVDAGQRADPGADVALDLGPERAARRW